MVTRYLFPNKCKKWGVGITIPSFVLGVLYLFFDVKLNLFVSKNAPLFSLNNGFYDEIISTLFLSGLALICFSREKEEDEWIQSIRLESLQWSIYANYLLVFVSIWLFYESWFFYFMVINMFTVLIVYAIRFNLILYRNQKETSRDV